MLLEHFAFKYALEVNLTYSRILLQIIHAPGAYAPGAAAPGA